MGRRQPMHAGGASYGACSVSARVPLLIPRSLLKHRGPSPDSRQAGGRHASDAARQVDWFRGGKSSILLFLFCLALLFFPCVGDSGLSAPVPGKREQWYFRPPGLGGAGRRGAGILHDRLSRTNHPLCHHTHAPLTESPPLYFVFFPFSTGGMNVSGAQLVGLQNGVKAKTRRAKGGSCRGEAEECPDQDTIGMPPHFLGLGAVDLSSGDPGRRYIWGELAPVTLAGFFPFWILPAGRTGVMSQSRKGA